MQINREVSPAKGFKAPMALARRRPETCLGCETCEDCCKSLVELIVVPAIVLKGRPA